MRVRIVQIMLLALALAGAVSCNSSTSPSPGAGASLSGAWSGSIVDPTFGAGTLQLALTRVGAGVSGTWTTTFAQAGDGGAGTVSGTAAPPTISLFLTPSAPLVCQAGVTLSGTTSLTAALANSRMNGTFVVLLCAGAKAGTFDVTRQ